MACVACSISAGSALTNRYRHHKRRQQPGQRGRPGNRDRTLAAGVQHKADGVGTGRHGSGHIGLAGEAADLDAGAVQLIQLTAP